MIIPNEWTFKSTEIADGFDNHVREQLPWYDLVTRAVVHFGRYYIPKNGIVYDIGASTGNIGNALRDIITVRQATLTAIEESPEMVRRYMGPGTIVTADASTFDFQPFDFGVLFLVLMFMPVSERPRLIKRLIKLIRPGGCIIVVDKTETLAGYVGTATRMLAMQMKIDTGTKLEDILAKELSLAGYQRQIDPIILTENAVRFFQFGEFSGWIIESPFQEDKGSSA